MKNTGQSVSSRVRILNASFPKTAQGFTTGINTEGYTLGSIGVRFDALDSKVPIVTPH